MAQHKSPLVVGSHNVSNLSDATRDEIIEALKKGRKIDAIKLYRDATGQGLREAKEFIETLTERFSDEMPKDFAKSTSGCAGMVLAFLVLGVIWFQL